VRSAQPQASGVIDARVGLIGGQSRPPVPSERTCFFAHCPFRSPPNFIADEPRPYHSFTRQKILLAHRFLGVQPCSNTCFLEGSMLTHG